MSPGERPFLSAAWRHLVMASFPVPGELLASRVPSGTRLDQWEGKYYVSIVAFRFLDTRVLGIGIPGHRDFEEINLRFYVRRAQATGSRRGVVFIREIVPRRAIALVARVLYNEPYVTLRTRSRIVLPDGPGTGRLVYEWKSRAGWNRLAADVEGPAQVPPAGSLEAFIVEHEWGYNGRRDGSTLEYRVEHPAWAVRKVGAGEFHADVSGLYGPEFVPYLRDPAASFLVAEGSPVLVYRGRRIRAG